RGRPGLAGMVVRDRRRDDLGRDRVHAARVPGAREEASAMADDPMSPEDRELRAMLGEVHTVAVVGLSSKPSRPSFEVARYLQQHGYRIVPVNPKEHEV